MSIQEFIEWRQRHGSAPYKPEITGLGKGKRIPRELEDVLGRAYDLEFEEIKGLVELLEINLGPHPEKYTSRESYLCILDNMDVKDADKARKYLDEKGV